MPNTLAEKKQPSINIVQAYKGFLEEPVPSNLFDAVVSGKANRILNIAKIGLLLAAGFLASLAVGQFNKNEFNSLKSSIIIEQLAVSSHVTFAQDAVYPVRVGNEDIDHLTRWLSYRLGKQVQIQSLSDIGYTLLGGNIAPDGDGVSAMLVYENAQAVKLSLFIRNAQFATEMEQSTGKIDDYNWAAWHNGQMHLVLVSEVDTTDLQRVFSDLQTR